MKDVISKQYYERHAYGFCKEMDDIISNSEGKHCPEYEGTTRGLELWVWANGDECQIDPSRGKMVWNNFNDN